MDDKTLADKCVALGVGYTEIFPPARTTFYFHESIGMPMDACEFLEKWDIAGALMEKVDSFDVIKGHHHDRWQNSCAARHKGKVADAVNDVLPRAIIEACVEAL